MHFWKVPGPVTRRSSIPGQTPVSLGYDRIRFLAPVFLGDTITVAYEVSEIDVDRRRSTADDDRKRMSAIVRRAPVELSGGESTTAARAAGPTS